MTERARIDAYLRQNKAPVSASAPGWPVYLTDRQLRQVRRARRRAFARATKTLARRAA